MMGLDVTESRRIALVLLDALRIRGSHVHLDNAIAVVPEGEVAVCVDEAIFGKNVMVTLE